MKALSVGVKLRLTFVVPCTGPDSVFGHCDACMAKGCPKLQTFGRWA